MLQTSAARDLAQRRREILNPEAPRPNPVREEQETNQMFSQLQSRKVLALRRGATEAQSEELALDGVLAYDPEEAKANQEAQALAGPFGTEEDVPG